MKSSFRFLWPALLCVLCVASCAKERKPIDRVQPYALDKHYFLGEDLNDPSDNPEFWTQGTLIDVGFGAAQDGLFTSTYAQPMSRIKWQITEDLLLARLAYERIEGSDGKGVGAKTNEGIIVAAYPIEKHFDIMYEYNSITGEETNIKSENDVDRPWYERDYIRVDFSRNLNVDSYDFDTLSLLGVYGGITYEPLAIEITDPEDPLAPMFDLERGYFDVTTKAFAKPDLIDLSFLGWGIESFPACYLPNDFMGGTYPSGSCSPVELTIRQSFRKVEDTDYEPVHWDGYRFQAFGAFTVDRYGYARNYGMSDDRWYRFISRYQIWDRTHFYDDPENMTGFVECFTPDTTPYGGDPHRDDDGDGTEDECQAVGRGSRCDTFRQRCTLPYAQRKTVTIPWYYTEGSNSDFFEATRAAAHQWDVALRSAARAAVYAECQRIGLDDCAEQHPVYSGQQEDNDDLIALGSEVDDCRAGRAYVGQDCGSVADSVGQARGYAPGVISIAKMPEMIVLCHSPVQANDHAACGEPGLTVRRGDLRYHQINVITEPQTPSPWGIYTDSEDPLTGETISASINVWSHVTDLATQSLIDKIRYIKGELSTEDVTDGKNVRDWANAVEAASGGGGVLPGMTQDEIHRRLASFTNVPVDQHFDFNAAAAALPEDVREAALALRQELSGIRASVNAASSNSAVYAARRRHAAGSEFEAELMNPMIQEYEGVAGMPMTDSVLEMTSPFRGGNPSLLRQLYHMKQNALAERGACILEPQEISAPVTTARLADILETKFGAFNPDDAPEVQQARAERMRLFLAHRLHTTVIVHEMGHSIGMRHNFVSSSDAYNYRPQYWQLRTRNGTVTNSCNRLTDDGNSCVGPRYYDPVTAEEENNLIWMYMHSSVMDYPGELSQDMVGLGAFDFAAARMFYGDTVAVYTDPEFAAGTRPGQLVLEKMDNFGGILGFRYTWGLSDMHYTELQRRLELIGDCTTVSDPLVFKPATWDPAKDGEWNPVLDGFLVNVNGEWTRCHQKQVDYVNWTALRMPTTEEAPLFYLGGPSVDELGRERVPYGFGTDSWADLGNLSVYRHDNGADAYEIFNFFITEQEVGHIFDNYRRHRQNFSVRKSADRTLYRYNTKLRDGAKGLSLLVNIYRDFSVAMGYDFDTMWPSIVTLFSDNLLASSQAFDHFTRMLARPEPGAHFEAANDPVLRSAEDTVGEAGETLVTIPNGATGYWRDVGIGGKPIENRLATDQGEYDPEITTNSGCYYDKINTAMLMTESVDNFISDSRTDFVDGRYRSVSLADLFPDGYRRWLGNNLTGDDFLKGPRVAADTDDVPLLDADGYPAQAIGWTNWWGDTAAACFPTDGTTVCSTFGDPNGNGFGTEGPDHAAVIDPQVNWEVQKFLIAWTMLYLPENEKQQWLDMLHLYELGPDADPGFTNRIEFHNPNGRVYVAKTFGKETLFGQTVQKGIAARVLEYANQLLYAAYVTTDGPDIDGDGLPDWYEAVRDTDGHPLVKWDPTIAIIGNLGLPKPNGVPGCNETESYACTCSVNRACVELETYVTIPAYLRDAVSAFGYDDPEARGIW